LVSLAKLIIFAPYKLKTDNKMKRITQFLSIMIAMLSMTLTSCNWTDDDEMVVYDLEGTWRGEIRSDYFNRRYGTQTEYTDVLIEFYRNPGEYAAGSGREVDYYYGGYSDVVDFDYQVRNGVIYMDYNDDTHVSIYNWELYNGTFRGEFHDYFTGEYLATFNLYKVYGGWDYGYNYYAKKSKDIWPEE